MLRCGIIQHQVVGVRPRVIERDQSLGIPLGELGGRGPLTCTKMDPGATPVDLEHKVSTTFNSLSENG